MKVYISGALAASKDIATARRRYEELAALLTAAGHSPYLPHSRTDPERSPGIASADVFREDMEALVRADAVVAIMDEPSLGVGAEIAIALERGIMVIGAFHRGANASRFVRGLLEGSPRGAVFEYDELTEIPDALRAQAESGVGGRPVPKPVGLQ